MSKQLPSSFTSRYEQFITKSHVLRFASISTCVIPSAEARFSLIGLRRGHLRSILSSFDINKAGECVDASYASYYVWSSARMLLRAWEEGRERNEPPSFFSTHRKRSASRRCRSAFLTIFTCHRGSTRAESMSEVLSKAPRTLEVSYQWIISQL